MGKPLAGVDGRGSLCRMDQLERRVLLGAAGVGALAALTKAGPLNPPGGAVVPTGKPLGEVEPRTAVGPATTPGDGGSAYVIAAGGSYYLTGNINVVSGNGITIAADNVTLDLNGFAVASTSAAPSGAAVNLSGVRINVAIRNGHLRGTTSYSGGGFTSGGFAAGISAASGGSNLRAGDIDVSGIAGDGINLGSAAGSSTAAARCSVSVCTGEGIRATLVTDCSAVTTGASAITASTACGCHGDCVGSNTGYDGVSAEQVAENCRGTSVSGMGVRSNLTRGCQGTSVTNSGVFATYAAESCVGISTGAAGVATTLATNCFGQSNSGNGLNASVATNCFGLSTTGTGMNIQGTATNCRAQRSGGVAINAGIAIGCTALAGSITSANKFLGTP